MTCYVSEAKPRVRGSEGRGFFRVLRWFDGETVHPGQTETVGPFATFSEAVAVKLLSYRED